jgi:hypothetical protein
MAMPLIVVADSALPVAVHVVPPFDDWYSPPFGLAAMSRFEFPGATANIGYDTGKPVNSVQVVPELIDLYNPSLALR